jgi:hypothetical protein
MCSHRTVGRWGRAWSVYLAGVVVGFSALEGWALATDGSPATLSAYVRRAAGLDPRCRHQLLGRSIIIGFFVWAAVHLGWGVLGPVHAGGHQ